ncbi:MAG: hypothetical protein E3J43_08805 [Candidatus Heimdallarchaeota archaeon]|nr:MAG: hypothetical protein E3J43_08805 [Candidatus Heimdallarchaeota archaeon]
MGNQNGGSNKDWKYYDTVNYIMSQQFFEEPHFIIDRRASKKIKIKNSGIVIDNLITIVKENIDPYERGEDEEFIAQLASKFNIRAKEIFERYKNKMNNLEDVQKQDKNFNLMVALSVIIEYFQKRTTVAIHKQLRADLRSKFVNNSFKKSLDFLHQTADSDFSLLLNIGVLMKYARVTKTEISSKYYDKTLKVVSKKLLKSDYNTG